MSTCISREGEYSEHEFTEEQRFVCSRCFVFDEGPALRALAEAEAIIERVKALADEWVERRKDYPITTEGRTGAAVLRLCISELRVRLSPGVTP